MVDREVLQAFGLDADSLKKKLSGERSTRSKEVNDLIDRIVNRCRGGRDLNLEKSNVFHALDTAWDAAFNQITPTLLTALANSDQAPDSESVLEVLRAANMDPRSVVVDVADPKTPNKNTKRLQIPAFFNITVPLCMAYVKIRQAKLVNDRKQVPFFKYEPVISDEINRMRCSLITHSIEEQSSGYGYFDTFKQAVFQMLHYSECLQFPVEEWHSESQWVEAGAPYEPDEEYEGDREKTFNKLKIKRVITREGLRYHLPHPSRTYWDRAYPAHTLNTNTGCSYAGYWRVLPWNEVKKNSHFYNLDKIGYSSFYEWWSSHKAHSYWTNVYRGCALNFPSYDTNDKTTPKDDNEKALARWYSREWDDKPIVIHEHFERVIPKDCGLGDYDAPVWIRFTLAADDTVIYAAPVCYDPAVLWWGYDVVHGRTHNASMTLEVLPFQDQFSNLLCQHLLSVKQNLMNISLIDEEIIPEKDIKELENLGERWWRKINLLRMRFSEKLRAKLGAPSMAGDPLRSAIISHKFPQQNTNETLNTMRVILDTLERVLVMSAQEVGQAASHEQTREEVRHIATNTSTRVQFTNTGIDSTFDAWKKQLYYAKMSYGRMSFYAQIPLDEPFDQEKFKALGFTAVGPYDERAKKQYIKGNKTAVKYEKFASDRDGQNRVNELESARLMIEMFDRAMANPTTAPAIGPDQAIQLMNQIGRYLGFPRDFKLENTGQTQTMQDQVGQALQQLQQFVQESLTTLQQDVQGALQNVMTVNKEQDAQLKTIEERLGQLLGAGGEGQRLPTPESSDIVPASNQELVNAGLISA